MRWATSVAVLFLTLALGISLCSSAEQAEPGKIKEIKHAVEGAGVELVTFQLTHNAPPKSFVMDEGAPRLVLDFFGLIYYGKSVLPIAQGQLVDKIRIGIHRQPKLKTRVVIDLNKDMTSSHDISFDEVSQICRVTIRSRAEVSASTEEAKTKLPSREELSARPLDQKPIPPLFEGALSAPKEQTAPLQADAHEPEQNTPAEVTEQAAGGALSVAAQPETAGTPPAVREQAAVSPESDPADSKEQSTIPTIPLQAEVSADSQQSSPQNTQTAIQEEPASALPSTPEETTTAVKQPQSVHPIEEKPQLHLPTILGITFDDSSNRGEMVLFRLTDFAPPLISALEKQNPRILCDFMNMQLDSGVSAATVVGGKYIKKIRAAQQDNPQKVRVVLELSADRDYDLQQVFFKNDNLFVLIISELVGKETGTSPPPQGN